MDHQSLQVPPLPLWRQRGLEGLWSQGAGHHQTQEGHSGEEPSQSKRRPEIELEEQHKVPILNARESNRRQVKPRS